MMGIQLNYFAAGEDLHDVASEIYKWDPGLYLFPERGKDSDLNGVRVQNADDLIPHQSGELHLLCPSEYVPQVVTTRISDGFSCIRIAENPILEYSPSAPIDSNTVRIGRLFVGYGDKGFRSAAQALFNNLKARATRLGNGDMWIFPQARRTARILRPWIGKDWENVAAIR